MTMSKRLLLHIGTGKTGSSSIQGALRTLKVKGLVYPLINEVGNQNIDVLFKSYESAGRGVRSKFDPYQFRDFKDRINASLMKAFEAFDNVVISSEYLFDSSAEQVNKIFKYFKGAGFTEIKVVLYLRNPASLYLSSVQQRLKASYEFPNPQEFQVKMTQKIERWSKSFGRENLLVREFSPQKLIGGDAVADFSNVLSECFNISVTLNGVRVNESISAEGMKILQEYRIKHYPIKDNVFFPDSSKLVNKLMTLYRKGVGSKPKLKDSVYFFIVDNHRADIIDVNQKYGIFEKERKILEGFPEGDYGADSWSELNDVLDNDLGLNTTEQYCIDLLKHVFDKS